MIAVLASVMLLGVHQVSATLASTLVAHWRFNSGNANFAYDGSGNGHNGKIIGATVLDSTQCATLSCLDFDGKDDVVKIQNSPALNFGSNGNFSISLWVKPGGLTSEGWLVDHRRNNDGVYAGYTIQYSSGTAIARIRDNSGHDVPVISTSTLNDGKFHHIAFVVNRGSHVERLYVDDHLDSSANIASVGNIDTLTGFNLGGTVEPNTPVDFFNGTLDEVSIYNATLTSGQIHYLFTHGH